MSIEKTEIKIGAAHELGCRLDDALEGLTRDLYRLEGSVSALRQAAQSVDGIYKAVDREMDEGKFDLEQASQIKKYVEKLASHLSNSASQAENNRITQTGKLQAMQTAVQIAKKFKEEEEAKAAALRAAYENLLKQQDGEIEDFSRPVGAHPAPSVKNRRLAEAAQIKDDEKTSPIDNSEGVVADAADASNKTKTKRQKK